MCSTNTAHLSKFYTQRYIKMDASVDKLDASNIDFHERIGEGGFGSVSRVSFKTPYKGYTEAASKTVLYELAKKEVEVMSKLHHPHIVNLLGFCEIPSAKLILMEYAPNGSLHDYLKDPSKSLPYQLQKKWAKESAIAITYLHKQNFLHRDIKPQNCLLFQDNLLKLCDFGLAHEIEESQTTSSQKGTYRYMAPEIHVGNERGRAIYSKPADIWAYGMLLLAICTRKPPFEDLEWHRVVFEVGNGAKPSIPKSCPKDLSDIMQQCWNNDPKQRPTSALIALALGACWSLEREIHPEHQGKQLGCCHITCCPNGDIVMAAWEKLYLLDGDGEYKMQLISTGTDPDRKMGRYVEDMCVSPLGYIFVVSDCCRFVHVFTTEGKYLHCFIPDENSKFFRKCLAIDREGQVLVGSKDIITVHMCPDGRVVNKIKYSFGYLPSMVINSKNQILIHSRPSGSVYRRRVVAIDYSGKEVFSFTPKIDEDVAVRESVSHGIVCDDNDNIYIPIRKQNQVLCNTCHIDIYSPTGKFLQCIVRGLTYNPLDLSMTPDRALVVANETSILKYSLK
ncbi:mitogen-activated protein kinase kinase kinase 12-like [Amphiura filiformis]|uniref:mitogen-activated protein kinase kinase kinase 12-like n=1 Tax=Amphiura filiformis TaxID=82378 RepID=UPI003B21BFED